MGMPKADQRRGIIRRRPPSSTAARPNVSGPKRSLTRCWEWPVPSYCRLEKLWPANVRVHVQRAGRLVLATSRSARELGTRFQPWESGTAQRSDAPRDCARARPWPCLRPSDHCRCHANGGSARARAAKLGQARAHTAAGPAVGSVLARLLAPPRLRSTASAGQTRPRNRTARYRSSPAVPPAREGGQREHAG